MPAKTPLCRVGPAETSPLGSGCTWTGATPACGTAATPGTTCGAATGAATGATTGGAAGTGGVSTGGGEGGAGVVPALSAAALAPPPFAAGATGGVDTACSTAPPESLGEETAWRFGRLSTLLTAIAAG